MFNSRDLTVNQWIIVKILLAIPLVNLILLIIWSFDSVNITLRNYSRAIIKLYVILIGIIVAVIIGLGGKFSNLVHDGIVENNSTLPITSSVSNIEEQIKFDKVVANSQMGITTVSGEVRNYESKSHSFTLIVTFYDENNNIIGTANGVVNNIEPNQLKTFEAISSDNLSNAKHYRVDIDTILN